MGRRWNANDAAVRDVRTKLEEEECASGMGQRWKPNDAAERRWEERRIKTIMFGSMRYLSWPVRQGLMRTGCWKFATDLFLADREIDSPLYFRNDDCYDAIIFLSLI
jgi:hypothetical protein